MDIYRKSVDNVNNKPIYYALVDNTIELAPTPDSSYTLQLTYYGTIDALSDTNTSNFISTSYPDAYLYGALKHASIYLMEDDRAALFSSQFEKALEEMRMEQEKAEFGKGSLMQRRRTYGKPGKSIYVWKNN